MASVGEKVPYFELPDQQGYPWSLSGELEVGSVVLVFYRGDWSPYCNGQLAVYARRFAQFERRGAQVAGVSVDPPTNNARLVGKLRLPFPLLSDPGGELARRLELWDRDDAVAKPAVLVLDRSGGIRYLYAGGDPADRPDDEEVFRSLRGIDTSIERLTGGPELVVSGAEARRNTLRRDRPHMALDQLLTFYQGAMSATGILSGRFGGWGRSGRKAVGAASGYETMLRAYHEALEETARLARQEA